MLKSYGMKTLLNDLLSNIRNTNFDLLEAKVFWEEQKKKYQQQGDEDNANFVWAILAIITIHHDYRSVHEKLQNAEYYEAWCEAEKVELTAKALNRHYPQLFETIVDIYRQVLILQSLYPYKLFSSSEILIEEHKCSICGKVRNFRNPCGHKVGFLYNGELCHNIVTKCQLVGIALVTDPVNKYAVAFAQDTNGKRIEYDYSPIAFLMKRWNNPYQFWNYQIKEKKIIFYKT